MPSVADLDVADWATLAVIGERDTHGWSVVRAMEPTGEVARVWACSRARVYRALDVLTEAGLVRRASRQHSRTGPARQLMTVTPAGRRAVAEWLQTPVPHVRDLRYELLLKLLFADRAGRDPGTLLGAQRGLLEEIEAGLDARLASATGFDRTLVLWRLESCRAALRFVDAVPSGGRR